MIKTKNHGKLGNQKPKLSLSHGLFWDFILVMSRHTPSTLMWYFLWKRFQKSILQKSNIKILRDNVILRIFKT